MKSASLNFHDSASTALIHDYRKTLLDTGHEINFFGEEPSGSKIFQSGHQGQNVRSH